MDGVIRCQVGEVLHYELGEEPEPRREAAVFDKPTRGTSVEKFREMVFNHLKVLELLPLLTSAYRFNMSFCLYRSPLMLWLFIAPTFLPEICIVYKGYQLNLYVLPPTFSPISSQNWASKLIWPAW